MPRSTRSNSKRRRIDDTPASGASKLLSSLSVTPTSSADDQPSDVKTQRRLTSDRYLPAWLSVFRSGNGDAKSLGRLATRTSKALTQLLEVGEDNRDEIWTALCRQQLGKEIYEAIPQTVKDSMGPRRLLAQMAKDQPVHVQRRGLHQLKDPSLTPGNVTFIVKISKGDEVIVSHAVTGKELSGLFEPSFLPDIHEEFYEDYDTAEHTVCGTREWNYYGSCEKEHPGEVKVELPAPVFLGEGFPDLAKSCKATVHMLTDDRCVSLLQSSSRGTVPTKCHCGDDPYDGVEYQLPDGEYLYGDWSRGGFGQGTEAFLDIGPEGDAILRHVESPWGSSIMKGLRFSLNLVAFQQWYYEDDEGEHHQMCYLDHLTFRFYAEYNIYGQCACECYHCRRCSEVEDPPTIDQVENAWKKSGVTIPHLLDHLKGVKVQMDCEGG